MANVDRRGGRESKNHERRVKRSLNAKANPFEKKEEAAPVLTKSPLPHRLPARKLLTSILDCGANLISRQLARDQGRMLSRAFDGGVDGVVAYISDYDRIEELVALVKGFPGQLHAAYGLGPDNVKRANEKQFATKIAELRAHALTPECVAIFAGLDLSRELASHYPQEALLDLQLRLASELKLPVVLTEKSAAERLVEKLGEWQAEYESAIVAASGKSRKTKEEKREREKEREKERERVREIFKKGGHGGDLPWPPPALAGAGGAGGLLGGDDSDEEEDFTDAAGKLYQPRAAIFDFQGDAKALRGYLDAGCYIILTGAICDVPASSGTAEGGAGAGTAAASSGGGGGGGAATGVGAALRALIPLIPTSRLLLASNSPLHTPQNIPDHYIRTTRNEPSNLPYVLQAVVEAYNADPTTTAAAAASPMTVKELAAIVYQNSAEFFGMQGDSVAGSASASAAATPAATAAAEGAGAHDAEGGAGGDGDAEGDGEGEDAGDASSSAAAAASSAAASAAAAATAAPTTVAYRCKMCRRVLFADSDIMPHDSSGLRPSAKAVAAAAATGGVAAAPVAKATGGGGGGDDEDDGHGHGHGKGGGKGGKGKKGKKGGRGHGDDEEEEEDGGHGGGHGGDDGLPLVGRWREAKGKLVKLGDQGVCRMHLIERQPWMKLQGGEAEGSLSCPGCSSKVGQYNLSGLKCSCGLLVTPAFKVPKNRVDAEMHVEGVDALDVALAAMDVADREEAEDGRGGGGDSDEDGGRHREKERKKKGPVSKHKGNFSEFRNKTTITGTVKRSGTKGAPAAAAASAAATKDGSGSGSDNDSDGK